MKLFKLLLCTTMLLLIAIPALAEEEQSKFDVFGGLNILSVRLEGQGTGGETISTWTSMAGWHASAGFNLNRSFALEADVSAQYDSPLATYLFLGGPKFKFPKGKFTPYAHFLAGVGHATLDFPGAVITDNNNLTLAMGGGLDYKVAPWISIKGIQMDYVTASVDDSWSNNLRFSFGAVFHLK